MKLVITLLLGLAMAVHLCAQPPSPAPADSSAAKPPSAQAPQNDGKRREDALKLIEATGAREAMLANADKMVTDGKRALVNYDPTTDPRFADEWAKRMKEQLNVDEYIEAIAKVYEKYFTDDEILQLTQSISARKQGKDLPVSPELQEKLKQNATSIQSDVIAETSRIGARVGGDIGQQIAKDHPDWVKKPNPETPNSVKP